MKKLPLYLFTLLPLITIAQNPLNLGFEQVSSGAPKYWSITGSEKYEATLDSVTVRTGNFAALAAYTGESPAGDADFKVWACAIPADYKGEKIKLTGYLKTEDVQIHAGLWMRIDPQVSFDNMMNRSVKGTTDWTKYEIELDYDAEHAKDIVFGGLILGGGKLWMDDLGLEIDGNPILTFREKDLLPAQMDSAFLGGSGIDFPELTQQKVRDLALLGQVWGFLKYHHPKIAKGDLNWDFELFRFLPGYLDAESSLERDAMLMEWIMNLGDVPACPACQDMPGDAVLEPDHRWMHAKDLSGELAAALEFILENRHQGDHYYIDFVPDAGNPFFTHESAYKDMKFPDAGFRLLALYRLWNMVQYYFPNRHLTDRDWSGLLGAYIPEFLAAESELAYEQILTRLIAEISDTHAQLSMGNDHMEKEKGNLYPPVKVEFIEGKLAVTDHFHSGFKARGVLHVGDVIAQIGGMEIPGLVKKMKSYYPASNEASRLRNIAVDILRTEDKTIPILVERNGESLALELPAFPLDSLDNYYVWYRVDKGAKCYRFIDRDIGYISLANISETDIPAIKHTFRDAEGIVIDIRNYPSAFVPFKLGSWFVSDTTPFAKFTGCDKNYPGHFAYIETVELPNETDPYPGKVIVLVNEVTQSQAEYTAMAFRAGDNTTILGSTTAGADGNISFIALPGGRATVISGIGVYYPDGTETQRVGILPDIVVKPTIEGTRQGRDELLEKAIELIRRNTQ